MTKADVFATIMESLAEHFRVVLTTPATRGYWMVMEDLTEAEMDKAAKQALRVCKFMPVASELLAFSGHAPRDIAAEATLAWDAVRKAMDGLDVYGNPDFGPLVNAVVRNLGGWAYLCEQKVSELEWRRKDFERVYRLWAEKDTVALPDGGPLFGYWKHAPITRIAIPGLPSQAISLAPVQTEQAKEMLAVVRELADSKTQAGAAPCDAGFIPTVSALPLRETKPKAPPMSAADVEARKAEIAARFAARGTTLPEAAT